MRARWRWGLMLLAVLVLGSWLFGAHETPPATASASSTASPGAPVRAVARPALHVRYARTPTPATAGPAERPTPVDPLLAAIPASAVGVVVLEAKTLFALPAGQLLARCLERSRNFRAPIDGVDKVERLAFAQLDDGRSMGLLLGELSDTPQVSSPNVAAYGQRALLFEPAHADAASRPSGKPSAIWNDNLWLYGDSEDDLRGAVDRLEGRTREPASIAANDNYGDLHGRVDGALAGTLLPPEIAEAIKEAGVQLEFHVDAADDLLVTIDAIGEPAQTRALGRSLEGALAALRRGAKHAQDDRLSGLLESYTLRNTADGLRLEATLSLALIRELLGPCAADG